jgi:hypothetical protein
VYSGDCPWINDINTPHKKELGQDPKEWGVLPKLLVIGDAPPLGFSALTNLFDQFELIFLTGFIPECTEFNRAHTEYHGIVLPYGTVLSKRSDFNRSIETWADFKPGIGLISMGMPEFRQYTAGIDGEQSIVVPENWSPTVPVQGWFHIAAMGAGDYIAAELHGRLMQSGLYRASDIIHVTLLGDRAQSDRMNELIFSKHQKYKVEHISEDVTEYEWASLRHLYKTAKEGKDYHLWYIHTKGASNSRPDVPLSIQKNIRRWRDIMSHYTIGEHRKCRYLLKTGHDTVGSLLRWNTGCIAPYYAGNFWWATADYIRTLPEPEGNRSSAEGWISFPSVAGKHFNQFWIETMDLYGFSSNDDQGPFPGYEII